MAERRRFALWVSSSIIVVVALVAYSASPFVDLYKLTRAVQAKDMVEINERVDFPAVRDSIAGQVSATYYELMGRRTDTLIGQIIVGATANIAAALMANLTPEALVDLISRGDIRALVPGSAAADMRGLSLDNLGSAWQLFANSEYGLRRFWLSFPPDKPRLEQFRVQLRLSRWRWYLIGVDLPRSIRVEMARGIDEAGNVRRALEQAPRF
jgi:hypothetical protein